MYCTQATVCTQYCTYRPKNPSAAFDLAPQTKTTTVCLAFWINPSSMTRIYNCTVQYLHRLSATFPRLDRGLAWTIVEIIHVLSQLLSFPGNDPLHALPALFSRVK